MFSFDETTPTLLCEIMGRHKSCKGTININKSWNNYTTFYYSIFKELREKNLRLFELGIGNVNIESKINRNQGSLYGWCEFFPNAKIFGADIDENILFETDTIKTFYCDQTNPIIIKEMWNEPTLQENFDIIIADGLHTFHANECFFENSIHKLNVNGYYIIESIIKYEEFLFIPKIKEWELKYKDCTFTLLRIPSSMNPFDNTLLVVHKC
jgi:hypothetical protein